MIIIKFQELHFVPAAGTFQRIIAEGRKNGIAPQVEASVNAVPAFGDSPVEFCICFSVSGI